jgi:hypothetical protein
MFDRLPCFTHVQTTTLCAVPASEFSRTNLAERARTWSERG